jgi:hypothetical protein
LHRKERGRKEIFWVSAKLFDVSDLLLALSRKFAALLRTLGKKG